MDNANERRRGSGRRIFGTTKGRILVLLCRGRQTVAELAAHLAITGNAVRAQLLRLERDGFVSEAGSRRGVRKPHVEYELTVAGRELFPTGYEPFLENLVDALVLRLPPEQSRELLLDSARDLARRYVGDVRGRRPRQRLVEIVTRLNGSSIGIEIADEPDKTIVRACSCPLASVTAKRPDLCEALAEVLGEVLKAPGGVRQKCQREAHPRCCFEVHSFRR